MRFSMAMVLILLHCAHPAQRVGKQLPKYSDAESAIEEQLLEALTAYERFRESPNSYDYFSLPESGASAISFLSEKVKTTANIKFGFGGVEYSRKFFLPDLRQWRYWLKQHSAKLCHSTFYYWNDFPTEPGWLLTSTYFMRSGPRCNICQSEGLVKRRVYGCSDE